MGGWQGRGPAQHRGPLAEPSMCSQALSFTAGKLSGDWNKAHTGLQALVSWVIVLQCHSPGTRYKRLRPHYLRDQRLLIVPRHIHNGVASKGQLPCDQQGVPPAPPSCRGGQAGSTAAASHA
jgi:hypothetical protein